MKAWIICIRPREKWSNMCIIIIFVVFLKCELKASWASRPEGDIWVLSTESLKSLHLLTLIGVPNNFGAV